MVVGAGEVGRPAHHEGRALGRKQGPRLSLPCEGWLELVSRVGQQRRSPEALEGVTEASPPPQECFQMSSPHLGMSKLILVALCSQFQPPLGVGAGVAEGMCGVRNIKWSCLDKCCVWGQGGRYRVCPRVPDGQGLPTAAWWAMAGRGRPNWLPKSQFWEQLFSPASGAKPNSGCDSQKAGLPTPVRAGEPPARPGQAQVQGDWL